MNTTPLYTDLKSSQAFFQYRKWSSAFENLAIIFLFTFTPFIMPRVEFTPWDRVYILKLMCTVQMTYSSFITMLYIYLIILQSWTSQEGDKSDVRRDKWIVIGVTTLDFGLGVLLAFAANLRGIRCRRRIIIWVVLETFYIPLNIFLLIQLHRKITTATEQYLIDPHYSRIIITQVCFLVGNYFFIGYTLDFLATYKEREKIYDPSIRPESVYAPTDPQITTTESRHIRMSQSFLCQPSTSRGISKDVHEDEEEDITDSKKKDLGEI